MLNPNKLYYIRHPSIVSDTISFLLLESFFAIIFHYGMWDVPECMGALSGKYMLHVEATWVCISFREMYIFKCFWPKAFISQE